jgi:putative SbcD/Mre11-related phosphoesterase
MNVKPLPGEPVLVLEPTKGKGERTIVLADLHIGFEATLFRAGMHLPSQTDSKVRHILSIVKTTKAKRVALLGDVKHRIGSVSNQEREEIPAFLDRLLSKVGKVDIVLGNHDGMLRDIAPEGIGLHKELVVGDVGLAHGHSWPSEAIMQCGTMVIAHNHPTVIFVDELGQRSFFPCWVRTGLDNDAAERSKRYRKVNRRATCIVMPAFDDLGRGTPFNLQGVKLLGPLLSNRVFKVDTAEVYLLDGTFLGKISDIMVTDKGLLDEQDDDRTRMLRPGDQGDDAEAGQ